MQYQEKINQCTFKGHRSQPSWTVIIQNVLIKVACQDINGCYKISKTEG